MNWTDPKQTGLTEGFKAKRIFCLESIYQPAGIAGMECWSTDRAVYKEELVELFILTELHSGGAKI